jgi:predicted phage terminase large subunit-like protein
VEPWEVISFPAIAEENDVLGRSVGEALWPERRPLEELLKIKSTVGPYWWSSLYQQRPTPAEGGLFKLEYFETFYENHPKIKKSCRFWDLAATKGTSSDYTVGLLLGISEDDNFYVLDVVRGKWEPFERDRVIRQVAELDGYDVKIRMEKEPGASGESLIDTMGRKLTGFNFRGIRSRDSKMARVNSVDGIASMAGVGRLKICKGLWTREFMDELVMFPNGTHDDQVDSLSGAYRALTQEKQVFVA